MTIAAIFRRKAATGSPSARRGRFASDERGLTAVEFAFVAPILLALLLAILQIGIIAVAQSQMENTTRSVARMIMTKQVSSDTKTQAQFTALITSKLGGMFSPDKVMINVYTATTLDAAIANPNVTFDSSGKVTNPWKYDTGVPGNLVIMQVMYRWPILLGLFGSILSNLSDGSHLLISTAVIQNEP